MESIKNPVVTVRLTGIEDPSQPGVLVEDVTPAGEDLPVWQVTGRLSAVVVIAATSVAGESMEELRVALSRVFEGARTTDLSRLFR